MLKKTIHYMRSTGKASTKFEKHFFFFNSRALPSALLCQFCNEVNSKNFAGIDIVVEAKGYISNLVLYILFYGLF